MKRILVVSQNDMLQVGIERLLGPTKQFTIHQSCSLEESEVTELIKNLNLDVIIIEANGNNIGSDCLTRLLNASKQLRVLAMEIHSNHVQIYEKREVQLQVSEDLIDYL